MLHPYCVQIQPSLNCGVLYKYGDPFPCGSVMIALLPVSHHVFLPPSLYGTQCCTYCHSGPDVKRPFFHCEAFSWKQATGTECCSPQHISLAVPDDSLSHPHNYICRLFLDTVNILFFPFLFFASDSVVLIS